MKMASKLGSHLLLFYGLSQIKNQIYNLHPLRVENFERVIQPSLIAIICDIIRS
jgi:hypothetical protein